MPININFAEQGNRLFQGFAGPVMARLQKIREGVAPLKELSEMGKEAQGIAKDLKGTAFQPVFDAGKYPVRPLDATLAQGVVEETALGTGLFMAMTPTPGKGDLVLNPEKKSQGVRAGDGMFRIHDYLQGIEALVAVETTEGKRITTVQVSKGTLYARMNGDLELVAIPAGRPMAFEFDPVQETGRRLPIAASITANPTLAAYRFKAEDDVDAQRAAHNTQDSQKRQQAVEKVVDKLKGKKIKIPKFW